MQNFETQEQLLQKRLAQAQAMRDQEFTPAQGQIIGGHFVRPDMSSALIQGLRAYRGMKESADTEQQLGDLQKKKQEAMQGDMNAMITALRGKPAETVQPLTPNDDEGNVNAPIQMPAQAGGVDKFYEAALKSQFPQFQQMGMQGMMQMPQLEAQKQEREDARAFRQQEAQAAREARAEELKAKIEAGLASDREKREFQEKMFEREQQSRKDMAKFAASLRPAPQPQQAQTLQTENGMLERVNGKWQPITIDGKPVMPKGSGSNAPTPEVAKVKDANDAISLLQQAAPLVRGATGSGIGAGADWLAGQVGVATKGAENIAQLKTIAGMLVSKMPKMTGPQSDKDVMLYKEMAGNIGDPNVPTALKEKAMQTIMEIQARYAGVQPPALEFGAKQMNPQDAQAMEWARANPNDPRSKAILQRLGGQ